MIPTPHTIGVRAFGAGTPTLDVHGNEVVSWGAPVIYPVYAIAPRSSSEPVPGRSEVIVGLSVYAPHGVMIGPRDRVVIDGEEYEVEGEIADYTKGPFGYKPGIVINLRRAEG